MSRQERLRQYKKPTSGPSGESRNQSTINYWSDRASANSLHPGKKDRQQAGGPGRSDLNHVGESDYLPGVRRGES